MPQINLVIFDCDGVLMDSELVASRAELSVYKKHGVELELHEFAQRFAGNSSAAIKSELEEEIGRNFPEDLVDDIMMEVDEKCASDAGMIPGADAVLDMFDEPRCICSNSPQHRLKAMLTRVKLYDRFRPYIFSAKDFDPPRNKPAPDVFNKALTEFGVEAREAVIIEDSVHGIEAAKAAGCRIVGFTGASHTYPGHGSVLQEAGAETVINRLSDLPAVIEAFRAWDGID